MLRSAFLENLFGITCVFCRKRIYSGFSCFQCNTNLYNLNKKINIFEKKPYTVASRFINENWIHDVLISLKNNPNKNGVIWLSNEIKYLYNQLNCINPILPVPGHTFKSVHLIEKIAYELSKNGIPVIHQNIIRRKLHYGKQQKILNIHERKNYQNKFTYIKSNTKINIVLLDDIITSGNTIRNISNELELNNINVTHAISVAFTRLKSSI